jgi:hypothetical protein
MRLIIISKMCLTIKLKIATYLRLILQRRIWRCAWSVQIADTTDRCSSSLQEVILLPLCRGIVELCRTLFIVVSLCKWQCTHMTRDRNEFTRHIRVIIRPHATIMVGTGSTLRDEKKEGQTPTYSSAMV